jgi:hypothetical protein
MQAKGATQLVGFLLLLVNGEGCLATTDSSLPLPIGDLGSLPRRVLLGSTWSGWW